MKTNKYWQKRFLQLTEALLDKGEQYYAELEEEYGKALMYLKRDIESFYIRFAENNEISMTEARRILDNRELKEFKWTVEEYIEKGIENAVDQRWLKELENASTRIRLSRFQSLEYQIRQRIELITAKRLMGLAKLSEELIKEGYYKTIYEIQKGFGIGDTFNILDTKTVESIIAKPWAPDGSNFSERIWKDREVLVNELEKELAQSFIRGDAPDTAIRNISKTMNTSKKAAGRLVMTESAFFANEARAKAFRELGVEEFQFLATLDMRTSEMCQDMDLKVFKLSEREIGVNWPPLHPWCRSTAIPHFEGNIKRRWARDPKSGKGYYVDGSLTYEEWYKEHVEGKYGEDEAETMRKKKQNEGKDLEQYQEYKKVLGDDLGTKSFEGFQELKYNDSERWGLTKIFYKQKIDGWIPDNMTMETWDNNKKGIDWQAIDFAPKTFKDHYERHSSDFGNITEKEYSNLAKDLLNSEVSRNIDGFTTKQGHVFRYDTGSNSFGVAKPDGVISTFYKPDKGLEYWKGEKKRYGKK
jgi:SPP1 gp7 family putative phage head morphogenesis protein